MTSTPPIGGAPAPGPANQTAAATQSSAANLNYDSFLKLLVAEMKNQDPLDPAKSTEYVAQFATFANVEQAIQTNTRLESMMTVSALTQADALIGRTLTSLDGTVRGTVESVRAVDGGIQAKLVGGETIVLGDGVSVA